MTIYYNFSFNYAKFDWNNLNLLKITDNFQTVLILRPSFILSKYPKSQLTEKNLKINIFIKIYRTGLLEERAHDLYIY